MPRKIKSKLVADGLPNNTWVTDIGGPLSTHALIHYIKLWDKVSAIEVNTNQEDVFS